jgi:hypothetical protein
VHRLYPGDIDYKLSYRAHKATEKRVRRAARAEKRKRFIEAQLDDPLMIPSPSDDERRDNMWLTFEKDTDSAEDFSDNLSDEKIGGQCSVYFSLNVILFECSAI